MHIDKELIQSRVSIEEACNVNGITIRRRNQILCPAHMERMGKPNTHYGNCLIYTDSNSYKCHSCGAGGDIFSLTMAAQHCDFIEAMKFLAENCCPEAIQNDNTAVKPVRKRRVKCPLSEDELRLLGLKSSKAMMPVAETYDWYSAKHPKEKDPGYGKNMIPWEASSGDSLLCRSETYSPENLFRDDEDAFWMIVFGKMETTFEFCKKMRKAKDVTIESYGLSREDWNAALDVMRNAAYHAKNLCKRHGYV